MRVAETIAVVHNGYRIAILKFWLTVQNNLNNFKLYNSLYLGKFTG